MSWRPGRRGVMTTGPCSLRALYRSFDLPGKNPLRDAHSALDATVRAAYGMKAKEDPLAFLLACSSSSLAGSSFAIILVLYLTFVVRRRGVICP